MKMAIRRFFKPKRIERQEFEAYEMLEGVAEHEAYAIEFFKSEMGAVELTDEEAVKLFECSDPAEGLEPFRPGRLLA